MQGRLPSFRLPFPPFTSRLLSFFMCHSPEPSPFCFCPLSFLLSYFPSPNPAIGLGVAVSSLIVVRGRPGRNGHFCDNLSLGNVFGRLVTQGRSVWTSEIPVFKINPVLVTIKQTDNHLSISFCTAFGIISVTVSMQYFLRHFSFLVASFHRRSSRTFAFNSFNATQHTSIFQSDALTSPQDQNKQKHLLEYYPYFPSIIHLTQR